MKGINTDSYSNLSFKGNTSIIKRNAYKAENFLLNELKNDVFVKKTAKKGKKISNSAHKNFNKTTMVLPLSIPMIAAGDATDNIYMSNADKLISKAKDLGLSSEINRLEDAITDAERHVNELGAWTPTYLCDVKNKMSDLERAISTKSASQRSYYDDGGSSILSFGKTVDEDALGNSVISSDLDVGNKIEFGPDLKLDINDVPDVPLVEDIVNDDVIDIIGHFLKKLERK